MKHKTNILLVSIIVIVMIVDAATALPEILDVFNAKYNTTGTSLDTCDTCHISGQLQNATNLNSYGMDIESHLNIQIDKALATIEPLDSDRDGFANIYEISNLTFPGNKSDFPRINIVASPNNNINRTIYSNSTNRTIGNNENSVTVVTANLLPTVAPAIQKTTTQKAPGLETFVSIFSIFILSKYINRKK